MKKHFSKTNSTLFIIIILGAILRLLCVNKVDGLWYDELISYKQASQSNLLSVIFYTMKTDIHFPLYQLILHYWSKLFSFSDYSLRSFSVICGITAIIIAYLIGKELKDKETGLICASIFAVNSFLIYYSQEVRMYSLMVLLTSCYLLFLLKIKNNYKNKWNYVWLSILGFALICSYTIAIVFVGFQFLALVIYLIYKYKKDRKTIMKSSVISISILTLFCIPLFGLLYLFQMKSMSGVGELGCDWSYLIVVLQDWFSPIINIASPMHYIKIFFSTLNIATFIFGIVPILLAMYSVFYSIKKKQFSLIIFSGVLFFLISEVIIIHFTPFKIYPRHTMIILPNLLVLVSYGFSLVDNKKHLKAVLISSFLVINLIYLMFSANSAFRLQRDGYKPLAQMINNSGVKQDDIVIVWNRRDVLDKYIKKVNTFSLLKNFAYTSEVILNNETELNKYPVNKKKTILRKYFADEIIPTNTVYIMQAIYNHMKPKQKFIIATTADFDLITPEIFIGIIKDNTKYSEMSYNNLLTIKALLDLKTLSYKQFHFIKKQQDKNFVILVFEKI